MENTHSEFYRVASYQCNKERRLKLESAFNFVQDALESYGQFYNFSVDFCKEKNMAWVVRNHDVRFYDLPTWDDKIVIDTRINLLHSSIAEFTAETYMADRKKKLFSSTSQMVLVGLEKMRPLPIKVNIPHIPAEENASKPFFAPIDQIERLDSELDKVVIWDYIDFNQHVNNASYVTFARQTLPSSFYEQNVLEQVRVAYKAAATLGDTMVIKTQKEKKQTLHRIVSKSDERKEFVRIMMNWRERE